VNIFHTYDRDKKPIFKKNSLEIVITWSEIIQIRDLVLINERLGQKSREAVSLSSFSLVEKSVKKQVLEVKTKKIFSRSEDKIVNQIKGSQFKKHSSVKANTNRFLTSGSYSKYDCIKNLA
jgi:hypothetical protein